MHLVRSDAAAFCRAMAAQGKVFDLVFADPPFDRDRDFSALPGLFRGILAPEGIGIIQFPIRNPPEWAERAGKIKRYGESGLAFFDFGGLSAGPGGLSAGADGIPAGA